MAAAMYILLIWGYLVLSTPQWYAVFTALVMSVMLLFWVSETVEECHDSCVKARSEIPGMPEQLSQDLDIPSLPASMKKLDALKLDLMQQYAQFGRDQSALNSKSLGSWHRNRDPGRHQT
jgi:hypothetical protein